jgi:hypothetical protein
MAKKNARKKGTKVVRSTRGGRRKIRRLTSSVNKRIPRAANRQRGTVQLGVSGSRTSGGFNLAGRVRLNDTTLSVSRTDTTSVDKNNAKQVENLRLVRSQEIYRQFSQTAYNEVQDTPPAGYQFVSSGADDTVRLYQNDDEYIITHRGTVLTNPNDYRSDVNLALGNLLNDPQFQERQAVTKSMLEDIPDSADVRLVGHSLGGTTALYAMNDPDINSRVDQVVTFNLGTTIGILSPTFTGDVDKILNVKKPSDPISNRRAPGKTRFVEEKKRPIPAILQPLQPWYFKLAMDLRNHSFSEPINGDPIPALEPTPDFAEEHKLIEPDAPVNDNMTPSIT